MVRQHVQKLPKGTSFWASLASYKLPTSIADGVHTLVSFEEGTIRWMCTYGRCWEMGETLERYGYCFGSFA